LLVILNLTPVVRHDFSIWVNGKGKWKEIMNTNSVIYWGTGDVYNPDISGELVDKKQKRYELKVHLPALGAVIFG
jgi:1,4-alpha-glucan branching enzyme